MVSLETSTLHWVTEPAVVTTVTGSIALELEANSSWVSLVDMSICRLGLGLGLKFEKNTFDWIFLSQIKAWKCMSYSKISLS